MTMNPNMVKTNLDQSNEVIDVYQAAVNNTTNQLEATRQNGPTWISILSVFLTIMLVWLALVQVGLHVHGFLISPQTIGETKKLGALGHRVFSLDIILV